MYSYFTSRERNLLNSSTFMQGARGEQVVEECGSVVEFAEDWQDWQIKY